MAYPLQKKLNFTMGILLLLYYIVLYIIYYNITHIMLFSFLNFSKNKINFYEINNYLTLKCILILV